VKPLREKKLVLPPEIDKFTIREDPFRGILGEKLNCEIKEIKAGNGSVDIKVPQKFLKNVLKDRYERKVEKINFNEKEVKIKLSDISGSEEVEDEKGEEKGEDEETAKEEGDNSEGGHWVEKARNKSKDKSEETASSEGEMGRLERIRNSLAGNNGT